MDAVTNPSEMIVAKVVPFFLSIYSPKEMCHELCFRQDLPQTWNYYHVPDVKQSIMIYPSTYPPIYLS